MQDSKELQGREAGDAPQGQEPQQKEQPMQDKQPPSHYVIMTGLERASEVLDRACKRTRELEEQLRDAKLDQEIAQRTKDGWNDMGLDLLNRQIAEINSYIDGLVINSESQHVVRKMLFRTSMIGRFMPDAVASLVAFKNENPQWFSDAAKPAEPEGRSAK